MLQQAQVSSSTANARRSSIASETTLVDTSSHKMDVTKKDKADDDDRSWTGRRASSSSSSRPNMIEKAMKKAKSKLGEKSSPSTPKPKPKPRLSTADMYPETKYTWQALAGKVLNEIPIQPRTPV
ncbi:hypothetical protein GGR52DRAFT_528515 [Hypoxylon sp. FL1284]|nr:hypothetical protein GGR52DRAFT_528515 [Hypoxylon sp. FL1284]